MANDLEEIELAIRGFLDAGDHEAALTAALQAYGPAILGYLVALLHDHDEGCEAFSLFSERLWKTLPAFRGESSFRTWAYGVAWYVLKDYRKHVYRRREETLPSSVVSQLVAQVRSASSLHALTAAEARVAGLRAQLSAEEQTLLTLRIDRDMSWKDVALVLGGGDVDPATLRKRFERLREKLGKLARTEGR